MGFGIIVVMLRVSDVRVRRMGGISDVVVTDIEKATAGRGEGNVTNSI